MDQATSDKIAELASDLTDAEVQNLSESEYQMTNLANSTTFTEATRDERVTEFVEGFRHTIGIVSKRDGAVTIVKPLVCETEDLENGETGLKGTISYAQKKVAPPRAQA